MRIYIVGPVASGKSTLAKKLSDKLDIPYQSLDELVHIPDRSYPSGNRKREIEERDRLFHSLIEQPIWIIEDVGRPCFDEGCKKADIIALLDIPSKYRNYRIYTRWIKQRMRIEKCIYSPSIKMLKSMLIWSRDYDTGIDNLKDRVSVYKEKVFTVRSNKDIRKFIEIVSM